MSIAETHSTFTISPKGLPDGWWGLERVEIFFFKCFNYNYLRIFYESLKSYKEKKETTLFSKPSNIEGKIYYRGRYFKDISPYNSDSGSSYLEMTQAPFCIKKSKGRYDGDGKNTQSFTQSQTTCIIRWKYE